MEIFRLEKVVENEKLDLQVAMDHIKKLKERLSNSLKRRKELAIQMKDQTYIEERIEDLCKERISKEADVAIEDLLAKNLTLHEEVRKLKREQKIHSMRMCEVIEWKDKIEDEIKLINARLEEKENEVQQLSLQQVDIISQLEVANQEVFNLRTEKF